MRYLLTTMFMAVLSVCLSAQSTFGNATTTYIAADACGNDMNNQYFIMVVGGPTKYGFNNAPPQVKSYCPASSTVKMITAYSGNTGLVAALNARTGSCQQPVFYDLLSAPYAGQAQPGTRLMLFTNPNPDISTWPANAFASICGQGPVLVACGNYQGSTPFFFNNNPYDNTCGAYSTVDFVVAGVAQTVQYKPSQLSAQDGAFIGINQKNIRYGISQGCACPGLECPQAPAITFSGDLTICEGDRTEITAFAGAGYNYVWSTGTTGASAVLSPELTTTYQVTVSNPANPQCSWVEKVRVEVFNQPIIPLTTMGDNGGPACYGEKMYLRTGGGQPIQTPFTYTWTPPNPSIVIAPDESVVINEQTAGLYTITYTFSNGCVFKDQIEATFPVQEMVKVCNNSPVCTGEPVTLQLSVPLAGGTCSWKGPGGFTANTASVFINAPLQGPYQVTVTDSNGCTLNGLTNVVIRNCLPAGLVAQVNMINTSCGLPNGSATAVATGGTSPYTYNWTHLNISNEPINIQNLAAGFYTVTITDAEGTTATATGVVQGSSAPDPFLSVTGTSCGNFNGTINLSVQYGTAPYTFDWADLPGINDPQQRTGLASGLYAVTVADAAGCTNTTQGTVPSSVGANITATVAQISCGAVNNGAIDITVGGGSAPYTFNWSDWSIVPEPEDRSNLAPGTYNLTVTAQNGCTASISETIQQPVPLALSTNVIHASCGLSNGSISVSVSGGTGIYSFDWADIAGNNDPQHRTNLGPGTYMVTVYDGNGCTVSNSHTVQQTGIPATAAAVTNIACWGNTTGAIQITVTGGGIPYSFNWADITTGTEPEDRTNLVSGTYSLTITDAFGCSTSNSYTLTQPAAALSAVATATSASCGIANGAINLNVNGGTTGYTFNWADLTNTPEPQHRTNLSAGVYSVTVTDANGCSTSTSSTITQPTGGTLSAVVTPLICFSDYSGQINVTVSGGTAPLLYNWQDITNGTEPEDRTGLAAGTYYLTVTNATGCTTAQSWVVTQPSQLSAFASTSTATSCGLNNGTLTAVATGGILPYTYDWLNFAGTNEPPMLTDIMSGTYTIKVTDNQGCTATKLLTVGASTAVTVTASVSHTTCGLNNGAVTLTCSGGGPAGAQGITYTYDWAHIAGAYNVQNLIAASSGSYSVTVTSTGGCTGTKVSTVNTSIPVVVTGNITHPTCGNRNGAIALTVTGATSPVYDWAHISGTSNPSSISLLFEGVYTVTVTSSNGCTGTKTFTLAQQSTGIASINSVVTSNTASSAPYNGAITLSVTGGVAPYTYNWAHIAGTNNPQNLTQLNGTTYTVTVTSAQGCTRFQSVTVPNTNMPNPPGNGGGAVVYANGQDHVTEDGVSDTDEAIPADKVLIFPNPATDMFYIVIPEHWGICTIRIYDSNSRLIRQSAGAKQVEAEVGSFAPGMYSVEVIPAVLEKSPVTLNVVVKGK